jgi:hypothetical protein
MPAMGEFDGIGHGNPHLFGRRKSIGLRLEYRDVSLREIAGARSAERLARCENNVWTLKKDLRLPTTHCLPLAKNRLHLAKDRVPLVEDRCSPAVDLCISLEVRCPPSPDPWFSCDDRRRQAAVLCLLSDDLCLLAPDDLLLVAAPLRCVPDLFAFAAVRWQEAESSCSFAEGRRLATADLISSAEVRSRWFEVPCSLAKVRSPLSRDLCALTKDRCRGPANLAPLSEDRRRSAQVVRPGTAIVSQGTTVICQETTAVCRRTTGVFQVATVVFLAGERPSPFSESGASSLAQHFLAPKALRLESESLFVEPERLHPAAASTSGPPSSPHPSEALRGRFRSSRPALLRA